MTRASERLHVTQPAISQAIKELENHYNVLLFERINNRLDQTAAGKALYVYAENIVDMFDSAQSEMMNQNRMIELHIGINTTVGISMIVDFVKSFNRENPNVKIFIKETNGKELEYLLSENKLDFCLMEKTQISRYQKCIPFGIDRLTVIVSRSHKFTQMNIVTIEQLLEESLLLRSKGVGSREQFDGYLTALGFDASIPQWECNSVGLLIKAVKESLGVAVLPFRIVQDAINNSEVSEIQIKDLVLERELKIIYHKNKIITKEMTGFIDMCLKKRFETI